MIDPTDLTGLAETLARFNPDQLDRFCQACTPSELVAVDRAMAELPRRRLVDRGLSDKVADAFARLNYEPTPKQMDLHVLPAYSAGGPFDVLWGGAAGGGKTRGLLMEAIGRCLDFPGLQIWLLRGTYPELRDSFFAELEDMNYAREIGASWNASTTTLRIPTGTKPAWSILKFRHAHNVAAATQMLSAQCQMLVIDERTTIPPEVVDKLLTRIRSGTRQQRNPLPVFGIRSGSNPGDVGHSRVKADFIDPAPTGRVRIPVHLPDGTSADRYYIPSKAADNPHLDADYYNRLALLPPDLQRAYRDGDWNFFEGMAFSEWRLDLHVVTPESVPIPPGSERAVGIDYGLAAPFCALWGAKMADGMVVVYRELYQPGLTPAEQAKMVLDHEMDGERPSAYALPGWLDPSCWARQPSSPTPASKSAPPPKSIAADYLEAGVYVRRANNDRIGGKRLVHAGLRRREDGFPRLLVYDHCLNLIRELPGLPRSKINPEDVDTNASDHAYDALRYLLAGLLGLGGKAEAKAAGGNLPRTPIKPQGPQTAAGPVAPPRPDTTRRPSRILLPKVRPSSR